MATASKAPKTSTAQLPAAPITEAAPAYLVEKVDETTGEVQQVPRFRYLPGHPRQIRFDAKAGQFNINGTMPLGPSLSFIPLAWRIFQDDILNMGRKLWAELFYADEKGAICAVLFHGYSVENLYRLIEPLFYDDLTLADVVVKVQASRKETTKDGKKATYYIAEFSYEPADSAEVQARRDFARDFPIWREETTTATADVRTSHGYRLPSEPEQPVQIEAALTAALAE
ncbi:hypothetical protein HNQ93_001746 [Hymenobacter luteus]|uniref:Uncharacterized protein n=2 Tax=Hymenobacter TaxID=89966 RepID=A0A7W9SZZ5_9BACT|nr:MULTISPECIES: hypothetical protein [Hymenobacter]MBB4600893.1 hypothetical protein [Hymenobacter latericoloratus]MBB6058900.1 hypothetical protein [Hymenobacter luteus]